MTSKISTSDSLPALKPLFAPSEKDDLSSHRYRLLIGVLGLMLPLLLWVIAGWRPTAGLERWELLRSVSAYYYTGAVAAFVGILVSLAMFLFTYKGYSNEHRLSDRLCAIIAGVAAIGVAFFPTEAPPRLQIPSWWTPTMDVVHYICAIVLFSAFFVFSSFLFPKSKVKRGKPLPFDKRVRNLLYRFCGGAMLVCMVLIFIATKFTHKSIFWPETMALVFFAVSWLVKGRADWTLLTAGRRTLHYGRHPGQLVGKVWEAIHD